jgi:nucleoside-diphosphate-sugar epimerase
VKIALTGITGFVGKALAKELSKNHHITGISRSIPKTLPDHAHDWRKANLFSLKDAENALEGADVGIYLIHSMMPHAALTQANFQDLDLICADNFARACQKNGVKRIIYLSGIIPEDQNHLSDHLKSRFEVEESLKAYGTPVTTLRAGLVIGPGGSSFEMLANLVKRLPAMICPAWTLSKMQPISLRDIVKCFEFCVDHPEQTTGESFDATQKEAITYKALIQKTAAALGKKRFLFSIPLFSPKLSKLWVTLFSSQPYSLVSPLVESLKHNMVSSQKNIVEMAGFEPQPIESAIEEAFQHEKPRPKTSRVYQWEKKSVCSIQRFQLPTGFSATEISEEYMRWLPQFLGPILNVKITPEKICHFHLFGIKSPLLSLSYCLERSFEERPLFYITGGLLNASGQKGRLEFRSLKGGTTLLAAIHDFKPKLPWWLYLITQSVVHRYVMRQFGKHLASLKKSA